MIDIIGYLGMALVLSSFLAKDVKWLRIINLAGSVFSAVYGFVTLTYPTALLNVSLGIINSSYLIYYIINRRKKDKK